MMNKVHRPRKRFGQNFLHDQNIINKIVAAINPKPSQAIVEIGPGKGALTLPLLAHTGVLNVIELDRDLIPLLKMACLDSGSLTIHQCDALRYDFSALATQPHSLRIVGNLPYNISTPLLFHLLASAHLIKDMHFMLQKEVVERLTAQPNTNDYGRLSVMIQYHCTTDCLFLVKPGSFDPPPQVDSAIVRLIPHKTLPYPVNNFSLLQKIVAQAFSQRRKTLRNSLKTLISAEALTSLAIDPQLRPENLSVQDYTRICLFLEKN